MRTPSVGPHTTPREAASELFWFWVVSVLALSGALVVLAGFAVLAGGTVQIVLGVLLILAIAHFRIQHRRRYELRGDPRLIRARERRGF